MEIRHFWLAVFILVFISGCNSIGPSSIDTLTPCPELECPKAECPDCPIMECPECPQVECPQSPGAEQQAADSTIPSFFEQELWINSPHNQVESPAFRYWDGNDPQEIPNSCAKCHSTSGFLDFLGEDGTDPGIVENAAKVGTTVTCFACHNETAALLSRVSFPSGLAIQGLGAEARCIVCHQGTSSSIAIEQVLIELNLNDDDSPNPELDFIEIHYSPAAATQMGGWAMGGYQYDGKSYDARFAHVYGLNTCLDCHDQHTLELKLGSCRDCHQGVDSPDDLDRIRGEVSQRDYDGDGNLQEGIYREVEGLQEILYAAIQGYAVDAGTPIVYAPNKPPYFYIDVDGNGDVEQNEDNQSNKYNAWTARLLKAAYNYHLSMMDPGAYIHGGKYIIQLLYDSIEDLDVEQTEDLVRDDPGHFAGSGEAWRHWDEDGEVPRECARCHSIDGLSSYLITGRNLPEPVNNGMMCENCHTDLKRFKRHAAPLVAFPSGVELSIDEDNNLCLTCHQGLESSASVEVLIDGLDLDVVDENLVLPDIHGYAAGATMFGDEAKGAYQYPGKSYLGRNAHVLEFSNCINCHGGHRLSIDEEQCATCHGRRASEERTKPQHHPSPMKCRDCHGMVDVNNIRGHKDYLIPVDYDGDGDVQEGLIWEISSLHEALYAGIQTYARDVIGAPIVYGAGKHIHFFTDLDGDGELDPGEAVADNQYVNWTPRLVRAAYNYLYIAQDPGAYAHNGKYVIQILYDSLVDMGVDTSNMRRP